MQQISITIIINIINYEKHEGDGSLGPIWPHLPPRVRRLCTLLPQKDRGNSKHRCEASMQSAAEELHLRVDATPSPVATCINTAVSFDSSWKTRGFYSNLGFGSAISTTTKKVLDYVLFNRICEKCNRWSAERQNQHPENIKRGTTPIKQVAIRTSADRVNLWSPRLLKSSGKDRQKQETLLYLIHWLQRF